MAEEPWDCKACTFSNAHGGVTCEMCGTGRADGGADAASAVTRTDESDSYWACGACTMQNVAGTFTCHMCGTIDAEQQSRAEVAGAGAGGGLSPQLLRKLAADRHFSLPGYLTELCHSLALAVAEAEAGMGRPSFDHAYIRVLLGVMDDVPRLGADAPLLACRALNYMLQCGGSHVAEVGAQGGVAAYLRCLAHSSGAAAAAGPSARELGQEAISGVDLLCRSSIERFRELSDAGGGAGGLEVLTRFIEAAYPGGGAIAVRRRSSWGGGGGGSSGGLGGGGSGGGGGGGSAGTAMADENKRGGGSAGAGPGAEKATAKALSLLRLLLDLRWPAVPLGDLSPAGGATADGTVGVATVGTARTADGSAGLGGGGLLHLGTSGHCELDEVTSALLTVVRGAGDGNRETVLSLLGTKVAPRLLALGPNGHRPIAEASPWLTMLLVDPLLLPAAVSDLSPAASGSHLAALDLTYQIASASPSLCAFFLSDTCPLLPAVLGLLEAADDVEPAAGGSGSSSAGDASGGGGSDAAASKGGWAVETPRHGRSGSDAAGPRSGGASGGSRSGARRQRPALADADSAARSCLGLLRLAGLAGSILVDGRLPPTDTLTRLRRQNAPGIAALSLSSGLGLGLGLGGAGGPGSRTSGCSASTRTDSWLAEVEPEDGGVGGGADGVSNVVRAGGGSRAARRGRVLADLGDGTALVQLGTDTSEVIVSGARLREADGEAESFAARARRSLARTLLAMVPDGGTADDDAGPLPPPDGANGNSGYGANGNSGSGATLFLLYKLLRQFICSGNAGMVRRVLVDGADPNRPLPGGSTPLVTAVTHERAQSALDLCQALLEAGADPNGATPEGSALHAAAAAGRVAVVQALLRAGADANAVDSQGRTPLEVSSDESVMAALTGHFESSHCTPEAIAFGGGGGGGDGGSGKERTVTASAAPPPADSTEAFAA
ncbi:unnamed protein product, partial [Phaeothamnion confervicola]